MLTLRLRIAGLALGCAVLLGPTAAGLAAAPQTSRARVAAAIENIAALDRPGRDGLATVWDGNKYVQCRRTPDKSLLCEAAGALMQPTLGRVLTPARVSRLAALHWRLDPSFGNYVQTFPAVLPTSRIADTIIEALAQGYEADVAHLDIMTAWVPRQPCPQRNGPRQNLAGLINDSPTMASTGVHACAYDPGPAAGRPSAPPLRSDRIASAPPRV